MVPAVGIIFLRTFFDAKFRLFPQYFHSLGSSIQTVHQLVSPCYFYQRYPAGVDSNIFNWALSFLKETEELRIGYQKRLLLFDGYSFHVQYKLLQYLKDNGVVVALPAHTSHILYPLDVTVFGPFKSFLQREVHIRAMTKTVLEAFDVADIIRFALSDALTMSNICSGFQKCGVWDSITRIASLEPLGELSFYSGNDSDFAGFPTLDSIL